MNFLQVFKIGEASFFPKHYLTIFGKVQPLRLFRRAENSGKLIWTTLEEH